LGLKVVFSRGSYNTPASLGERLRAFAEILDKDAAALSVVSGE
jgi:hypothetical protein